MNFKKIKPKTINNNNKKFTENNKIRRYENNNDYLFGQNINQSLSENKRIINNYNNKLFMTNENEKEQENIIINKISRNEKDINEHINHKNCSYLTEPNNNNYIMINEMKFNDISNADNSMNSNNNNSLLKDFDLIYNNNQLSKTEKKENLIDYNDFLKYQFDRGLKNDESDENIKILELSNKELIKRCEELIEDNRLLNSALNERTSKLNKIIKENVALKAQISQLNINAEKTEKNIIFYEKQIQNYKYEIDNYQKLINEFKSKNIKLNIENNNESQNDLENDFKKQIKEEILIIKKNLEEINIQNRGKYSSESDSKNFENNFKNIYEENKLLKEKIDDLKTQNELIKEENTKLLNQNNIFRTQIDTYINQINDLNKIIENKDNLINILKEKEKGFENKDLIKNNSCCNLKTEKTELYNEDIIKLMKDNKDNKLKLELLNDKLKNFDIIKKKYDELINYKIVNDNEINNRNNNIMIKKEGNEESDLIEIKKKEKKLKDENIELNKKINELNLELEKLSNKNKNLLEELNEKQNEIEKLKKEINEKDRIYKLLKTETNTKIKEFEINIKKYKEELIEKNEIINNLKDDKEKIKLELELKTKGENSSNKENKNQIEIKQDNINKGKNEEELEEKNIKNINDEIKNINENEKINKEYKKEENEVDTKKEEKKEGRKYIPSLRNRFLRKKEEERKLKEKEKEKEKNEKINSQNETNIIINNKTENKEKEEKKEENKKKEEEKLNHGNKLEEEKDEVKESIRQMNRKKNYTHKPRFTSKNYNLEEESKPLELSDTQVNNKENKENKIYLYGIDRNDYFHIFDVINKKYEKMKVSELKVDEKSLTFKKDYQYEGTIIYNTLNGIYILTGEKVDSLYYFNSKNNTISKICKFNLGHDNGSILYDDKGNNIFVFGGKKMKSCEYYNFSDKKVYEMPDLITDRANASFIISNGKIFGFFGFSYEKNDYTNNIEYIEYNNKEQWIEIKNINLLSENITFDIESMATTYYKNNEEEIMIYDGIKGENEDFISDFYLIYNTKNNEMRKIKSWEIKQFKSIGKKWRNYIFKKTDPQGFHFAKNTRFLNLDNFDGYSETIILIDYKNNVHFVDQKKELIEIYRGNI